MRALAVAAVAAGVLVGAAAVSPAATSSTSPLRGTYTTVIEGARPAALNGRWFLTFDRRGRYRLTKAGVVLVRGQSTIAGRRITFAHEVGPASCTGEGAAGVYRYTRAGKALTLVPIGDSCYGRRTVLGSHPLTKVG